MKRVLFIAALLLTVVCKASAQDKEPAQQNYRLLYWNIQNGMWDGQEDNYARFLNWVNDKAPDICVWCESQPIYKTNSSEKLDDLDSWRTDSTLVAFWNDLAQKYGHKYVFLGGHRDNYPQVITSRFPIDSVARLTGSKADTLVAHGAGWARISLGGETINLVTVHTWPHRYAHGIAKEDREANGKAHGGDYYRATEIEYICKHTILGADPEGKQLWMMMGDFNSITSRENWVYHKKEGDTKFLVHDFVNNKTPYIDIIAEREPNNFHSSTPGRSRIDYVYVTPPMFEKIKAANVIFDSFTRQQKAMKDGESISKFYRPSDHLPIIVDFCL